MTEAVTASLVDSLSQPLSVVASHAEASARWLDRPSPEWGEVRASVAEIVDASRQMAMLIQRGRDFLGPRRAGPEAIDVAAMLAGCLSLLEREFATSRVTAHCFVEADLPPVRCDAAGIEQVALSLMLNGIEAIRAKGGARRILTVTAARAGDAHVSISIADTSAGTSRERPDIAICREVVVAHGGTLWGQGVRGGGTDFTFTLPLRPPETGTLMRGASPRA